MSATPPSESIELWGGPVDGATELSPPWPRSPLLYVEVPRDQTGDSWGPLRVLGADGGLPPGRRTGTWYWVYTFFSYTSVPGPAGLKDPKAGRRWYRFVEKRCW